MNEFWSMLQDRGGQLGIQFDFTRSGPISAPVWRPPAGSFVLTNNPTLALVKPTMLAMGGSISSKSGAIQAKVPFKFDLASPNQIVGFDSDANGSTDSFYLTAGSFNLLRPLTLAGLVSLEGVRVDLKDISNHPQVAAALGQPAGSWEGSIKLAGSKVSFPTFPRLTLTPLQQGTDAWRASYGLSTGDLKLALSNAAYRSPRLQAMFQNTELTVAGDGNTVSLVGSGQFSLPDLGFRNIQGSLNLSLVDQVLKSISADVEVPAAAPITGLGLSGKLAFSHDAPSKTGNITVTQGTIAGVVVNGRLDYSASGNAATDLVTGQLSLNNRQTLNALKLDLFDQAVFSIVPLEGRIDFSYAPKTATTPGGSLNFSNIDFDIVTGSGSSQKRASFAGNLQLKLDGTGKPTLQAMDLTLKQPIELSLGSLGVVRAEAASDGTPVRFTLAKGKNADGTESSQIVPTLSGQFTYQGVLGTATAKGIVYEQLPGFDGYYDWFVADVSAQV